PSRDALRVKVHVGAHRDYVTLSFYLDASKPWNGLAQSTGPEIMGVRRQLILSHVDRVRTTCEARLVADALGVRPVDHELLPEQSIAASDASDLLKASRYLYSDLWDEFC